jgi:hypothetical protein
VTATASSSNGWAPVALNTQLPGGDTIPQQASVQAGMGQAVFFNASGHAAINDGTVPGLVCAGVAYPDKMSALSSTAAATQVMVHQGIGVGQPASTISLDSFTAADVCTPCFDAGNGVPGKKSNHSGSNRSLIGIVLGVDERVYPRVWAGPVASAIGRGLLLSNSYRLASTAIADAAASDAIAERTISHAQLHGVVTSIVFNGAAIAADNTDYITVTVSKRDGAGGGAVSLGTYDSRAANNGAVTAFVDASFTLSVVAGALNLLETDVVTITTVKGGSGKVITGVVLVNGKVI